MTLQEAGHDLELRNVAMAAATIRLLRCTRSRRDVDYCSGAFLLTRRRHTDEPPGGFINGSSLHNHEQPDHGSSHSRSLASCHVADFLTRSPTWTTQIQNPGSGHPGVMNQWILQQDQVCDGARCTWLGLTRMIRVHNVSLHLRDRSY